jgi:hypothetical protein
VTSRVGLHGSCTSEAWYLLKAEAGEHASQAVPAVQHLPGCQVVEGCHALRQIWQLLLLHGRATLQQPSPQLRACTPYDPRDFAGTLLVEQEKCTFVRYSTPCSRASACAELMLMPCWPTSTTPTRSPCPWHIHPFSTHAAAAASICIYAAYGVEE